MDNLGQGEYVKWVGGQLFPMSSAEITAYRTQQQLARQSIVQTPQFPKGIQVPPDYRYVIQLPEYTKGLNKWSGDLWNYVSPYYVRRQKQSIVDGSLQYYRGNPVGRYTEVAQNLGRYIGELGGLDLIVFSQMNPLVRPEWRRIFDIGKFLSEHPERFWDYTTGGINPRYAFAGMNKEDLKSLRDEAIRLINTVPQGVEHARPVRYEELPENLQYEPWARLMEEIEWEYLSGENLRSTAMLLVGKPGSVEGAIDYAPPYLTEYIEEIEAEEALKKEADELQAEERLSKEKWDSYLQDILSRVESLFVVSQQALQDILISKIEENFKTLLTQKLNEKLEFDRGVNQELREIVLEIQAKRIEYQKKKKKIAEIKKEAKIKGKLLQEVRAEIYNIVKPNRYVLSKGTKLHIYPKVEEGKDGIYFPVKKVAKFFE